MPSPSNTIRLRLLGLPAIDSLDDFSAHTHLSRGLIFRLCRFGDHYYKIFRIPKKSSGYRTIAQPSRELKAIQAWILRNILDRLHVSSACKGFEKHASIRDNAIPHIGSNSLLCIDIENFFQSISVNQVWSIFRTVGYSPQMSATLAALCVYNNRLPQGAPTSPKLANLSSLRLDARLLGYVGKRGIVFTRYADDMTFSAYSKEKLIRALPFITSIVQSEGFALNDKKTRLSGPGRQRRVTGLIINDEGASIGRKQYRLLRAKIHSLTKYQIGKSPTGHVPHISGWLAYVKSIDQPRYKQLIAYIQKLKAASPKTALSEIPY